MPKKFEIRDPIHGFVEINEWERDIINHPAFQRLRRIKQLSWTDMVYPGANHSRFEHALGVMHIATKMFDSIVENSKTVLNTILGYDEDAVGIQRDRVLVRLAALLHDLGHSPYSHSGEELMPQNPTKIGQRYNHEDYSGAIVLYKMKDVIDCHRLNQNYRITVEDIKNFLEGNSGIGRNLIWRSLINSQLDADRADYLLRDAYHIGVKYGQYDLNRLISTLNIGSDPETGRPTITVNKGGIQVAESLILARYLMFTQVYFHHTRRAYDLLVSKTLKSLLPNGKFPPPTEDNIDEYLSWDDWKVGGMIVSTDNPHCVMLKNRQHYRCIFETRDIATLEEIVQTDNLYDELRQKNILAMRDESGKSWYNIGTSELIINMGDRCVPLSTISSVVGGLKPVKKLRIYVPLEQRAEALSIKNQIMGG